MTETHQNLTDSSGHVEGPVGAFDCIKFGQLGGKLEVKRQNMATAIYAKIKNLDYLTLCTICSHLTLSETYQNITDPSYICSEEAVKFWWVSDEVKWLKIVHTVESSKLLI